MASPGREKGSCITVRWGGEDPQINLGKPVELLFWSALYPFYSTRCVWKSGCDFLGGGNILWRRDARCPGSPLDFGWFFGSPLVGGRSDLFKVISTWIMWKSLVYESAMGIWIAYLIYWEGERQSEGILFCASAIFGINKFWVIWRREPEVTFNRFVSQFICTDYGRKSSGEISDPFCFFHDFCQVYGLLSPALRDLMLAWCFDMRCHDGGFELWYGALIMLNYGSLNFLCSNFSGHLLPSPIHLRKVLDSQRL